MLKFLIFGARNIQTTLQAVNTCNLVREIYIRLKGFSKTEKCFTK